jgi:hypothetical protein
MYNNPYEYFRQDMNAMNQNLMDNMQDMGAQSPFFNQMPTMPMQPIQPMMPMGTMPSTMGMGTMPGGMGMGTTPGGMGMGTMPGGMGMGATPGGMGMGTTSGTTTTPLGGVQEFPGTTSGSMPTNIGSIPIPTMPIAETPVTDIQYTQGWLTTQIGQRVKIEFLIGTNMLIDREGTLLEVGISYVIINEVETDDLLLCDIYSIKFVRVYR